MEIVLNLPPEVRFGFGAVASLNHCLQRLGGSRVSIITDQGIVKTGLLNRIQESLKEASYYYTVYDEVEPNPCTSNCYRGLKAYKDSNCDILIAIGGGSAMDAAKGIQLLATHGGELIDYDVLVGGIEKITRDLPPLIAIPTTAGTGSEVSAGAVITDEKRNQKVVIVSSFLIPSIAIVDPEMTMKLPRELTAATGADALTHCIEVYVARNEEPLTELMMLYGIELCGKYLKRVVEDTSDKEAKRWMAFAATVGGMGINVKGLGASHSLSHQLSTDHGIHHGLANAIMLPYVMKFNLDYAEEKYANIARAIGVDPGTASQREVAQLGIHWIESLISSLGLNLDLTTFGVTENSIERMAEKAMNDPCHSGNPRVCKPDLMKDIYLAALKGEL